jgi:CheY-like chemotaxis protein
LGIGFATGFARFDMTNAERNGAEFEVEGLTIRTCGATLKWMAERSLILVVEDNEVDLLLIRRAFAKAKVLNPLFSVNSGEEAIAYFKGAPPFANRQEYPLPDLVLLDLNLRGLSGLEVLKWVRDQPGLRALRVVMLTGSAATEDINKAYQLGANSFLVKPMDFDSFVQIAGAVAGYWVWMSEVPETSRPAQESRDPSKRTQK